MQCTRFRKKSQWGTKGSGPGAIQMAKLCGTPEFVNPVQLTETPRTLGAFIQYGGVR